MLMYDAVAEARAVIMQYLNPYNRSGPHSSLVRKKKTLVEADTVVLLAVELAA